MLLVGQLVGIVSFSGDLAGSIPSTLRLEQIKFAVIKIQSYLLVSFFSKMKLHPINSLLNYVHPKILPKNRKILVNPSFLTFYFEFLRDLVIYVR